MPHTPPQSPHAPPRSPPYWAAVAAMLSAEEMPGMRVAYLVSQYPAASHTFIQREVDALRLRGVAIETFSIRRPETQELQSQRDRSAFLETHYVLPAKLTAFLLAHAVALLTRPISYMRVLGFALRHRVPGLRAAVWAIFHFAEAISLARELERRRVEHLHNHFANAGATVGLLASRFLRLPWSMTLHGISETDYPAGLLLGAKIEAADFVACVSHFGRAQAMRVVSPEQWDKLFVVHCALNLSELPCRVEPTADARLCVVCVARMSPEKGHIGLLEAFAAVRARGIDVRLALVGDGPERGRIERRIEALGLRGHVTLFGWLDQDQALKQIATSDMLVLTSFMEGLPIVLMEAMALGVPVIASRVAGIPELVVDGEEGLLFCPADWTELAERMTRLLTDRTSRDRLAQAGRAKVRAHFDISRAVEPLLARFSKTPEGSCRELQGRKCGT